MLKGLEPSVAAKVASKWGADQQLFFEAVKEYNVGKEAHEWATPSCSKCYGRGYTGILLSNGTKLTCKCATKNYQKWLQAFRVEFNTTRDEQNADEQTTPSTSGPENTQEAQPDSETHSE